MMNDNVAELKRSGTLWFECKRGFILVPALRKLSPLPLRAQAGKCTYGSHSFAKVYLAGVEAATRFIIRAFAGRHGKSVWANDRA